VTELQRENRSANLVDAELDGLNFRGYAAVFNSPWSPELIEEMGYTEQVAPGAFRKALGSSGNIPLLWQHDRRDLLATTKGGTLTLKEDGKGLLVGAVLPDSPFGLHVREMIERGDVRGMSYGVATAPNDSTIEVRGGHYFRILRNARKMLDVTLTFEPAYEATTAELRTLTFTALPLQTLIGGPLEAGQTEKDVAWWDQKPEASPASSEEPPPPEPGKDTERARAFYLEQLAWEGNRHEG